MAAQEEDDKNLASYQTRQYDKALKEFLNTFNMHIDQIELGKMTKKEVWEYMLARKNNFIAFLNKQGNVDVIIREALEAAHQQALERWRTIPPPPPAATPPVHQETNSVKPAPDLSPQNKPSLPPVIQAVLTAGLLRDTPINGKYNKRGGKNDMCIITWIFDYSGYKDDLTADLYMQYINTNCTAETISRYISRERNLNK